MQRLKRLGLGPICYVEKYKFLWKAVDSLNNFNQRSHKITVTFQKYHCHLGNNWGRTGSRDKRAAGPLIREQAKRAWVEAVRKKRMGDMNGGTAEINLRTIRSTQTTAAPESLRASSGYPAHSRQHVFPVRIYKMTITEFKNDIQVLDICDYVN